MIFAFLRFLLSFLFAVVALPVIVAYGAIALFGGSPKPPKTFGLLDVAFHLTIFAGKAIFGIARGAILGLGWGVKKTAELVDRRASRAQAKQEKLDAARQHFDYKMAKDYGHQPTYLRTAKRLERGEGPPSPRTGKAQAQQER